MVKPSILQFLSCLTFCFATLAYAVDSANLLPSDQAFSFTAKMKNADTLLLSWDIAGGCYLYRDKFKFVSLTPGIKLGEPSFPASHTKHDANFGDVQIFQDHLDVEVLIQRQDPKLNKLILEVHSQGCTVDGVCYMPSQQTVSVDLSDDGFSWWGTTSTPDRAAPYISEQNRIAASLKTGSVWLIALSFLGFGILLAFTPCVFPMLPILSGIIVGQGSNLNTHRAFWLSLSYVLASALTYTVFGVLAGLFGSNLQVLFQEPWVIMTFSGVFVLLALSMLGSFQFQIPAFIQTKIMAISSKQRGGNPLGAVIMGILSALAIGPCVTAPLTGALIYIGQTGDAYLGGLALFALGIGMGIPLIIAGTYAGKLLPKAGAWMAITKVIFGMGLLAVAVWLLSRIMPPAATLALWALLVIFPVLLMLWKKHWKGAGLLATAYGILLWVGISTNQPGALQPLLCNVAVACKEQLALTLKFKKVGTMEELQENLAAAQAKNQWVMLDFYADWCTSCQEMALNTFADSKVRAALSQVVLVQADVTKNSPTDQALLRQFDLIGPPAILFFGPDQRERSAYRVVGYLKADKFLDIINQVFNPPIRRQDQ
ncbi:MAG: protein-disulfide reductase DsbD [Gammaproteobacteria bacterium]